MKSYMAIDQYGTTYHNLGRYPRAGLLERLCRKHAQKMYCDMADGTSKHIGYIIAGLWCRVYEVTPMRRAA